MSDLLDSLPVAISTRHFSGADNTSKWIVSECRQFRALIIDYAG